MKNLHLLTETEFETYLGTLKGQSKNKAKGQRGFEQQLTNSGYILLSEYINNNTKVSLQCDNPDHEPYYAEPRTFKSGSRCPACSSCCPKHSKANFLKDLDIAGYTLLGEYINARTKVWLQCDNPHHEPHWNRPFSFKQGVRCPACSSRCPKQAEKDFLKALHDSGYTPLGKYVDCKTKVPVQCNIQGHAPFNVKPNDIKSGTRCPACATYGYDPSKQGTLYVTLLEDMTFTCTKIGITNHNTYKRYAVKDHSKIQRAWEHTLEDGYKIQELEKHLHALYEKQKKNCGEWLSDHGNTELFEASIIEDVLKQLDFVEVTK